MGAQRNAAARGGGCAGAGWARRKDGGVPRRTGRGRAFRRGGARRAAVPGGTAGVFGAEAGGFSPGGGPPTGRGRGLAAWGPQRPRVGRDGAGRARAGRRGAGGIRRLSGADAGKARAGRRYTAGGPGIAGGGGPIAGARRHRTGKKRSELRGLCRVTGHRWEWRQRRGRKGPFSLYKEALFAGTRALSIQS